MTDSLVWIKNIQSIAFIIIAVAVIILVFQHAQEEENTQKILENQREQLVNTAKNVRLNQEMIEKIKQNAEGINKTLVLEQRESTALSREVAQYRPIFQNLEQDFKNRNAVVNATLKDLHALVLHVANLSKNIEERNRYVATVIGKADILLNETTQLRHDLEQHINETRLADNSSLPK